MTTGRPASLSASPPSPIRAPAAHVDYFGNWVHQFHILPEHRSLRVESEFVVLVHPQKPETPSPLTLADFDAMRASLHDEHFDWLAPTRYCPLLPGLNDLTAEAESGMRPTFRPLPSAPPP